MAQPGVAQPGVEDGRLSLPPEPLAWDDPAAWDEHSERVESSPAAPATLADTSEDISRSTTVAPFEDDLSEHMAPENSWWLDSAAAAGAAAPDHSTTPDHVATAETAAAASPDNRPRRLVVAAVLSGLLTVPMVAGAGSLFAQATADRGIPAMLSGVLALALLTAAAVNLTGAFRLAERHSARWAQVGGYLTITLTAMSLTALLWGASTGAVAAVALVFLAPAITMLTLLGTPPARRWLAARRRRTIRHPA